jgi:hypothetical protein
MFLIFGAAIETPVRVFSYGDSLEEEARGYDYLSRFLSVAILTSDCYFPASGIDFRGLLAGRESCEQREELF